MKLVFHAGAHLTEEDRLLKSLSNNRDAFAERGVDVPDTDSYRELIGLAMQTMEVSELAEDAPLVLQNAIRNLPEARRMVLSDVNFIGGARMMVKQGVIYPDAEERLAALMQMFQPVDAEIFIGLRNPATFLPAAYARSPSGQGREVLGRTEVRQVRWSELIERIQKALPDVAITLWCNEDAPLIWPALIRTMVGLGEEVPITGSYALLEEIMQPEGISHFRAYLEQNPDLDELQIRRASMAFLDRYAASDAIEEEIDMPGWTDALIEELSGIYDRDVLALAETPGVRVLLP
ncbi:hypothetical protein [uncultured Roseobacter sp.]|uniref:hypothetical protein n=1 Tax=uncultured Roseobacter sp. TaxID=114847 RepID=UPI002621A317|nr:hypothetical protein [uncultured Roseobacter sp.]